MLSLTRLQQWLSSTYFWGFLILFSLSMEGTALFYQYVLDEPPCVLCIHFRLLFMAIIFLSLFALWAKNYYWGRILSVFTLLFVSVALAERSYQLLGTERHFVLSDCSFALNFPEWIAVDKWLPWMFKPMTSCGYTPEVLFGITMAEALSALSVVLVIFSLILLIASFKKQTT